MSDSGFRPGPTSKHKAAGRKRLSGGSVSFQVSSQPEFSFLESRMTPFISSRLGLLMFQVQKRKDTPRERTTHRKLRRSSWDDDILKVSTGYSALSIVLRCYVKT